MTRRSLMLLGAAAGLAMGIAGLPCLAEVREAWVQVYPYGSDNGRAGASVDSTNNVYVSTEGVNRDYRNVYATLKYSPDGKKLWEAQYDSKFDDGFGARGSGPWAMTGDELGNTYVTGSSYGGRGHFYDYATVKYDSNGKELWVARYDRAGNWERPLALAVDKQGNVYITGESDGPGLRDAVTVKYSPDGKQLWAAVYDFNRHDETGWELALDGAGNVYVGATSQDNPFQSVILKYNPDGKLLWEAFIGYPYDGTPQALAVNSANELYVSNETTLLKYAADGTLLWRHKLAEYGLVWYTGAYALGLDRTENLIVAGNPAFVADIASDGTLLWNRLHRPPDTLRHPPNVGSRWTALALDAQGNIYVTGQLSRWFTTAKFSPEGRLLWLQQYVGSYQYSIGWSIALDSQGAVCVVGVGLKGGYRNTVTIKYEQTP